VNNINGMIQTGQMGPNGPPMIPPNMQPPGVFNPNIPRNKPPAGPTQKGKSDRIYKKLKKISKILKISKN